MKKGFSKTVGKLFSPEQQPLLFLVMSLSGSVALSGSFEMLRSKFSPLLLTIVSVGLIILLILYYQVWKPWFEEIKTVVTKRGFFSTSKIIEKKQYKGLIVFASKGLKLPLKPAVFYSISEHIDSLEKCWVIAGDEDTKTGSLANALSLKDDFKEELEKKPDGGKDFFEIKKLTVDEAYNPSAVYDVIENIFSNLPEGMKETDVISDYTGGTKSMSAGMILACALPSRDLQVLKPNKLYPDGTADLKFGQYPIGIDVQFKVKKRSR